MRLVDLSHTISDGLITYPGLPGPVIADHLSFEASRAHYAPGMGSLDHWEAWSAGCRSPVEKEASGELLLGRWDRFYPTVRGVESISANESEMSQNQMEHWSSKPRCVAADVRRLCSKSNIQN